jgi:hypothetical protein
MSGFRSANSGEARYFSNSDSQAAAVVGGREPVMGFHSVMLSLRDHHDVRLGLFSGVYGKYRHWEVKELGR